MLTRILGTAKFCLGTVQAILLATWKERGPSNQDHAIGDFSLKSSWEYLYSFVVVQGQPGENYQTYSDIWGSRHGLGTKACTTYSGCSGPSE